jgi:hypothetical protein
MFVDGRQQVATIRAQESEFFYRRGIIALIEGDIVGAKKRFEQTPLPAIKEWDLPAVRHADADRFLRLIELAEKSGR